MYILLFLCINSLLKSQTIRTYASYELSKNKNNLILKANGKLLIKGDKSVFILSQYNNLLKSVKDDNTVFMNKRKVCYDDYIYYNDYNKHISKFQIYDYSCDTKRLIVEQLSTPKWNIENTEQQILGYNVKKATAIINQRKWIVYYTPNIKTKYNLWRFTGLDGLVVWAEDSDKIYTFKLTKVEMKQTDNVDYFIKDNIIKSTFIDFKSLAINEYWKMVQTEFIKNLIPFNKKELPKYETLEFMED